MGAEKRLIDAKGKFVLNSGDLTGHIMCIENGYATVFDRFAKVICKFSLLDAPTVDAVEVVHGRWIRKPTGKYTGVDEVCCSICGCFVGVVASDTAFREAIEGMNYCSNCGTKMDGDGNG